MSTYAIKAPNGKTYQIDGPAGASDDQVRAQVLKQFPEAATATTQPAGRNSAPPVPVATKQQDVQAIARQNLQRQSQGSWLSGIVPQGVRDFSSALNAGVQSAMLGLPEAVDAGIHTLGNVLRGKPGNFQQNLRVSQAENEQNRSKNIIGNIMGQVAGAVGGGNAITAGIRAGGERLAASRVAPAVTNAIGRTLVASQDLKKGQVVRNTIKAAATGGAVGAADAAIRGNDVGQGAAFGAAAVPALAGTGKVVGFLGKKAAAVLNLGNAATILKNLTSATVDEMSAKLAAARANGVEPTLFELLPLADRNRLASSVVNRSDNTLEATQRALQPRLSAVGPEMANVTNQATAPGRARVAQEMTDAVAAARGAEVPGDAAVAAAATRQPDIMAAQPGREASLIMEPHDNSTLFNSIDELMPSHPELQKNGEVHNVPEDPAVTAMIRGKAKLLNRKNSAEASGGLTGRNVSDLLGELNAEAANPNNPARDVARAAVQHIEQRLTDTGHGDFLDAHQRMLAAYAARRRMVEGASEGMLTRTQASRDPNAITQASTNAYSSPEGASGRLIGQANKLQNTFAEAALDPKAAIAATAKIPGNQAALAQNLGPDAAGQILDAATTQSEGARALAGLNSKTGTNATSFGPEELASVVLGLNPASMIRTKAMALHRIVQALGVSEKKSGQLVDLLFSTNPAKRQQVLDMLNRTPEGQGALSGIGTALGISQAIRQNSMAMPDQSAPMDQETLDETAAPTEEAPESAPAPDQGGYAQPGGYPVGQASPYAPVLDQTLQSESPEFQNLIERQFNQESGNQHFDKSGRPKTSSAGAIGVAQVMPSTAPVAAQLAGVPYDPQAYRYDPAYNKLIGTAYMKAQLLHFDGDVAKALAAYNAGPGAVERAISRGGQAWLNHVPAETQNYVLSILGG